MNSLIKTRSCIAISLGVSVVDFPGLLCGWTLTLRTRPSLSVFVSIMVPVDHCNLGVFFSQISTISFCFALRLGYGHLALSVPISYIYFVQSCQN